MIHISPRLKDIYGRANFWVVVAFMCILAPLVLVGSASRASIASLPQVETNYDLFPVVSTENVPPLVMLVMSRDEQLFIKAYTDYTDLDGDGIIDTTYNNNFTYAGYFGSDLCYSYGSSNEFIADNNATSHQCSGEWSGNFLNWLTMSRLDIVRSVLYGGKRSVDTPSDTVLERAAIPNDLHAWAKVYSGSDINLYTPYNVTMSFCNATMTSGGPPLLRAASGGPYPQWATTEITQCHLSGDGAGTASDEPASSTDFTVRVDVCGENGTSLAREPYCRAYLNPITSVTTWKPAGLLQHYGENGQMRFGLMTGSDSDPRTGGRLRRNIGLFAGNGTDPTLCAAGDEVKLADGTFCGVNDGTEGIVRTLDQFALVDWSGSVWTDCGTYDILNRNNGGNGSLDDPGTATPHGGSGYHCNAWGNPLSEIYAEAVRYIEGHGRTPNPLYVSGNDTAYMPNIPDQVPWVDPYGSKTVDSKGVAGGGNPYCATCSILVLSTGLNSFDADELASSDGTGFGSQATAYSYTNKIGTDEGLSGNYLIGRVLASPGDLAPGISPAPDTYQDLCTGKSIGLLLGLARGICPDIPSMEGSYYIAGLAFAAWTNDLRPDLTKPTGIVNRVQTYAVQLAESLPSFAIPTPSGAINFAPLCQSNNSGTDLASDSGWRSCYLGDVRPGVLTSIVGSKYTYGRPLASDASAGSFALVWEDSLWGNDHDLDAMSMITYCVGSACSYQSPQTIAGTRKNIDGSVFTGYDICWRSDHNKNALDYSPDCAASNDRPSVAAGRVLVRNEVIHAYAGNAMLTGYSIYGVASSSGPQRITLRPGNQNGSVVTASSNPPSSWYLPQVISFTAGSTSAGLLPNPLFYAAKYGGFVDHNNNGVPDQTSEWDSVNNATGAAGADGLPDNFFPVHNPALLGQELGYALNAILRRTGSGTAAAVVADSVNGQGVVYRAIYQSQRTDGEGRSISWIGDLSTLWIDGYGLLREDGNQAGVAGNGVLDDYVSDPIVVFTTDPSDHHAEFEECVPNDPTTFNPANFAGIGDTATTCQSYALDKLQTVWSASKQLWSDDNSFGASQRAYTAPASTGRYIFTWVDANHNGLVDSGEQRGFVWSGVQNSCADGFCGEINASGNVNGNMGFLNTSDPAEAQNIVNWIRGVEEPGMRSRTVDYEGTGDHIMRLGDIVDSTPLVVGSPVEHYDQIYGDTSYATFKAHYRDRRQMVYVGADDGLLHAFNGGYYNASTHSLSTSPPSGTATNDPLGSEVWAYAPGNLLPHLRWLTDPSYKHVFYVDGSPVATDAKIFTPDTDHPGGWGTIMVVPFRLGGGQITVPTPTAGSAYSPTACPSTTCTQQTSYSAYVVLDVTNPEVPPTVLAELTPASTDGHGQSFTTSEPAFGVVNNAATGSPGKFYLFLGSGPTDATGEVTSTAPLRIYAYDMSCLTGAGSCSSPTAPIKTFDLSNGGVLAQGKNSFAGDLIASDFNLNDESEALYFGSVRDPGGTVPIEFEGSLWKINLGESSDTTSWTPELLYNPNKPIVARPTLGLNQRTAPEIYDGTGRLFTKDDLKTTGSQQIFGLIDPQLLPSGDPQADFTLPLSSSDLLDVTSIGVCGVLTSTCTAYGNLITGPSGAATINDLDTLLSGSKASGGKAGFFLTLAQGGTGPAERIVSSQALLGGVLITNSYIPGTDVCTGLGSADEYVQNFTTGTGSPGSTAMGVAANGTVNTHASIGYGLPAPPSLHAGFAGQSNSHEIKACTQTSTGAILCQDVTALLPVVSGEISWREPLDQ